MIINPIYMDTFQIIPYTNHLKEQMIVVWEKSVLATHHFLSQNDFEDIKQLVQTINFEDFMVFCLVHQNNVIGFIGILEQKVEMLFLLPDYFGKNLGKKLMLFAIENHHINQVDVNEQNLGAVDFYKKLGFETYQRNEKDDLDKNYPILKMKLKS